MPVLTVLIVEKPVPGENVGQEVKGEADPGEGMAARPVWWKVIVHQVGARVLTGPHKAGGGELTGQGRLAFGGFSGNFIFCS